MWPAGIPIEAPGPGVYRDVPMADYHAWDAASNSRLSQLARSAAHLKAYIETPPKDTDALRLGRAIHTAVLEPDAFPMRYRLSGRCVAKTQKGEQCSKDGDWPLVGGGCMCTQHLKAAKGDETADDSVEILKPGDMATCLGIRDSVKRKKASRGLLYGAGQNELSCLWIDRETGQLVKGRMDRQSTGMPGGAVLDLKSCRDARRSDFERSIFSYRYFVQGALYTDGAKDLGIPARHYVILALEKKPPFEVGIYRLADDVIDAGREMYRPLLRKYAECVASGEYPGFPDEVQDIGLPGYAWRQLTEQIMELEAA